MDTRKLLDDNTRLSRDEIRYEILREKGLGGSRIANHIKRLENQEKLVAIKEVSPTDDFKAKLVQQRMRSLKSHKLGQSFLAR